MTNLSPPQSPNAFAGIERETDLGGTPTEWNDLPLLIDEIRTLVQHGGDPVPWLPRLLELQQSANADARRAIRDFMILLKNYLGSCAAGTPDVHEWKVAIEAFHGHREPWPAPPS